MAPTAAPSLAPTIAPTGAPTRDCNGLELSGTSSDLDGLYRKDVGEMIAGREVWKQVRNGDGVIFFSDSVLHTSWVINSDALGEYWLSEKKPQGQPPLSGDWEKYIGALPFIETTETLSFICYETLPPTPEPTPAPTLAPSLAPSYSPSHAPSLSPTIAPTPAPTEVPTDSPTTLSPTMEPTMEPTFDPTQEPTPEACAYLLMLNPFGDTELDQYTGLYVYEPPELLWTKSEYDGDYVLERTGGKWVIGNSINGNVDIIEADGPYFRPPYFSDEWRFSSGGTANVNFTLDIECANTSAPSNAPTTSPSLAPSSAPTSSCMGLHFNNEDDAEFKYNGWFQRQDDYPINGHKFWISVDLQATVEYLRGSWYLMEKDNDLIDDEDPVMLTMNGSDFLSPPSGMWYYAANDLQTGAGAMAMVTITCGATFAPTPDPTSSPSNAPTDYVPQTWETCPDSRLYFTFISNVTPLFIGLSLR